MSDQHTFFRSGGMSEYLRALRKEEREALVEARKAVKGEADPALRRLFRERMREIRREFRDRRKAARGGLFVAG